MTVIFGFIILMFALAFVQMGFWFTLGMVKLGLGLLLSGIVALICYVRSFVNNRRGAEHF